MYVDKINTYKTKKLEISELHCVNVNIISNKVCGDRSHYNGGILKVPYFLINGLLNKSYS